VIDRGTDFVWVGLPLSVTVAVKAKVPLAVGVPEITPVPAARVSPAGRLPLVIDHVYAGVPPVARRLCEYVTPSVPEARAEVGIVSCGDETGAGAIVIETVADCVCTGLLLSVTATVKL
jgi:hypothetical protein